MLRILLLCFLFTPAAGFAQGKVPKVLDADYELELLASEPDLVTPVGIDFDAKGRLLVIESHTHFRPKDYQGPPADRIRVFDPGKPKGEQFSTFYEGSKTTMSLAAHPDGSLFVATRNKIFRLRDRKNSGQADDEVVLVHLDTKGDYPHNGLCGLAFGPDGWLTFGMGENLGLPYKIIARDGTTLAGGGEGGNIFRCKLDGSQLERIATGLWNPFGICVDPRGRIFTVDNDPDSRPPCRLIHVAHGADYGFQFRYGRPGIHPLQAWDGELPGTLPMVAGTGEAPCTVLPYRGDLWVTSWGDYRIERYRLQQAGASWKANRHVVVQGDDHFRPVGMAVGPDGALYFSDWVERSYPIHGKGRLWRLKPKSGSSKFTYPALNADEARARALEKKPNLEALNSTDPFTHQAAVWGLISTGTLPDWKSLASSRQRLGLLYAHRWLEKGADQILPLALDDADPEVRLLALRWIADRQMKEYKDRVRGQLDRKETTVPLAKGAIATLAWLDHSALNPKERQKLEEKLSLDLLQDEKQSPVLRTWLLRSLPANHGGLTPKLWSELSASADADLKRETVWTALLSGKPERSAFLAKIAQNAALPASLRADALVGLEVEPNKPLLESLTKAPESPMRTTAARMLRGNAGPKEAAPPASAIDAWMKLLETPGDAEAGRRWFYAAQGAKCASCHSIHGRGASVGPDLTQTGKHLTKRKLVESILQPSRDIAPLYQPLVLEMNDGRTLVGYSINKTSGEKERFVGADGKEFVIDNKEVASRQVSPISLMPEGLEKTLTLEEFRDLLAFLQSNR